jgi:hypothetical protein
MANYKITNITDKLGKRDFKSNSELEITVVSGMVKKNIKLKPNDSVFLRTDSLPLSVHRLRVKGLITVSQVDDKEMPSSTPKKSEPKPQSKKKPTPKKPTTSRKSSSSSSKKTYTKKSTSSTTKSTSKED